MHSLIKPQYFMPVHGEALHLQAHRMLADELGMKDKNIFMMENGKVLEMTKRTAAVADDEISAEDILVDGLGVGDVGHVVLHDREILSESGIIMAVAVIDWKSRQILSGPEIITRGFVYVRENEDIIRQAENVVTEAIEKQFNNKRVDPNNIRQNVRDELKRFIYRTTEREPLILPIFLEI